MYIALYDENIKHITNVDNATYDLTQRVYDNDSYTADGVSDVDVNDAKIAVTNDDAGNYKYACFADTVTPDKNKRTIKGADFKTLFDTEILLDYTAEGSFDGRLSAIYKKVAAAVFGGVLALCSSLFPQLYNTTAEVRALAARMLIIMGLFLPLVTSIMSEMGLLTPGVSIISGAIQRSR